MVGTPVKALRASRSRWLTAAWAGLILIGLFYVFGAVSDLAGDATGIPSDHTRTFGKLTGSSFAALKGTDPGTAHYITLLERGYAIHELVLRSCSWWSWRSRSAPASGGPGGHAGC